MRAAIFGLAMIAAGSSAPAQADDDGQPNGDCLSIRLTEEVIWRDIEATHGRMFILKGAMAKRYLEAIAAETPADNYAELPIYERGDVTNVGLVTPDMESACPFRTVPAALHFKALILANSKPA